MDPADLRKANMSKKIILLALAAVSAVVFALPAMAMAEDSPLHVVPKPEGSKKVDGVGTATLTGGFGSVECTANSGTASFTSTTSGSFEQTFTGCKLAGASCTTSGQASGTITTQSLPFDLLTVAHTPANGTTGPGILVTPNAGTGQFATFTCGFLGFTVKGNGLIGTITKPACGSSSTEATVEFSSSSTGVQTHKTVVGTETEYSLENLGSAASEDAEGTITLGTSSKLECT
jgi:hypothetical protein